jgi:hypothetical protein
MKLGSFSACSLSSVQTAMQYSFWSLHTYIQTYTHIISEVLKFCHTTAGHEICQKKHIIHCISAWNKFCCNSQHAELIWQNWPACSIQQPDNVANVRNHLSSVF